jgi:hypothetical protein
MVTISGFSRIIFIDKELLLRKIDVKTEFTQRKDPI